MTKLTAQGSSRIGFFALSAGCCVLVALIVAAIWQVSVHNSRASSAESHAATAAGFQSAETEGLTASDLLKQYVATGDQTLLPQAQSHTTTGVKTLAAAVSGAGSDYSALLTEGSKFVDASGQIIALRQTGDVHGAATALTNLSSGFAGFIDAQNKIIASEQDAAASQQDSADRANTAAVALAASAGALALALVLAASVFVGRRLMRRRVAGTPFSA